MKKTIKVPGGVLVRVITAIEGFHEIHGTWPDSVAIQADSLAALATYHLTPLGFFLLQSKVELSIGPEGDVLALGRSGKSFSYANQLEDHEGAGTAEPVRNFVCEA